MPSKANLLGHSIHPMLVAFPIGLLSLVPVFDIVHLATGTPLYADVAFWMLTCGIIGGLVAAVPGLIDFLSLPAGTRAYKVGLRHMLVNVSAIVLYIVSWAVRQGEGAARAGAAAFVLGLVGFGLLLVGGWLGGELVERLGVIVAPNANPNAPSSLMQKGQWDKARRPTEPRPI